MTFEQAFSEFIDRKEYDGAEQALFNMVRMSFRAGWLAAGGNALLSDKVFVLQRRKEPCISHDGSDTV